MIPRFRPYLRLPQTSIAHSWFAAGRYDSSKNQARGIKTKSNPHRTKGDAKKLSKDKFDKPPLESFDEARGPLDVRRRCRDVAERDRAHSRLNEAAAMRRLQNSNSDSLYPPSRAPS